MRLLLATVIVLVFAAVPNIHQIGSKPETHKSSLNEAIERIRHGSMPLPRFLALHPDANVSPKEAAELKVFARVECSLQSLAPQAMSEAQASATGSGSGSLPNLQDVSPGKNAVAFEGRKPLSAADRSDAMSTRNQTLRKHMLTSERSARH